MYKKKKNDFIQDACTFLGSNIHHKICYVTLVLLLYADLRKYQIFFRVNFSNIRVALRYGL